MSDFATLELERGCRDFPLRTRFLAVLVMPLSIKVVQDGSIRKDTLCWALGASTDGPWEALGAWPVSDLEAAAWQVVADDLRIRGVERIRFVGRSDRIGTTVAMETSVPGITLLPWPTSAASGRQGAAEPFLALSPRHRRQLCVASDAAIRLNRSLERAIARHGCFPTSGAATAFVADWLARAERKRDRAELALSVAEHRRFIRARARSGTACGVGLAAGRAP